MVHLRDKKVFVVHKEVPYFSEALGFSLPSLLVNQALCTSVYSMLLLTQSESTPQYLSFTLCERNPSLRNSVSKFQVSFLIVTRLGGFDPGS